MRLLGKESIAAGGLILTVDDVGSQYEILRSKTAAVGAVIAVGLTLRLDVAVSGGMNHADHAVMGLIAKQIYLLNEFPLFIWEAHYAGTAASYLGAALFAFIGPSAIAYNLVDVALAVIWMVGMVTVARRVTDGAGALVALLLTAIPPFAVLLHSMTTSGLVERLCVGVAILLLLMELAERHAAQVPSPGNTNAAGWLFPAIGFMAGFGLWIHPITLGYSAAIPLTFFCVDRSIFASRRFVYFLGGLVAGVFPAIMYNLQNRGATFLRLGARGLHVEAGTTLSSPDLAAVIFNGFIERLSLVPGLIASLPITLVELMGPANVLLLAASLVWAMHRGWFHALHRRDTVVRAQNVLALFVIGFLLTYLFVFAEAKPRHALAMYTATALLGAAFLRDLARRRRRVALLLLVAVVGVNGYGVARARIAGPRPDPAALAAWLEAEGETHGFSDYQGAYSTLFYSLERVVVSPTIIDAMNDRRPAYTEVVRASARPFFVLYSARYPDPRSPCSKRALLNWEWTTRGPRLAGWWCSDGFREGSCRRKSDCCASFPSARRLRTTAASRELRFAPFYTGQVSPFPLGLRAHAGAAELT